jgi:hypothetical protein
MQHTRAGDRGNGGSFGLKNTNRSSRTNTVPGYGKHGGDGRPRMRGRGQMHVGGTMGLKIGKPVGFMWIGHFKKLAKNCGVQDCHIMPLLRLFHDAGWLRCYMVSVVCCPSTASCLLIGCIHIQDLHMCS